MANKKNKNKQTNLSKSVLTIAAEHWRLMAIIHSNTVTYFFKLL